MIANGVVVLTNSFVGLTNRIVVLTNCIVVSTRRAVSSSHADWAKFVATDCHVHILPVQVRVYEERLATCRAASSSSDDCAKMARCSAAAVDMCTSTLLFERKLYY